jgi:glycosyltransferase involved in cell wall biosynthesis
MAFAEHAQSWITAVLSERDHSPPVPSGPGGGKPCPSGAGIDILYHHRTRSSDGQSVHIDALIKALGQEGASIRIVGPRRVDAMSESRGKRIVPKPVYELLELAYSGVELVKLASAIRKRRPDAIYERANVYTLSGVWAARLFSLPLILEVNAPLAEERAKFGGLALPRIARWSEKLAWRAADYVLPVTGVLGDLIESAGARASQILVTSNGIDVDQFSFPHSPDRSLLPSSFGAGPVLGFVGYVRAWHGLPQIVELLARDPVLSKANLLIVGDGPGVPDIVRRAGELGVAGRVCVTGIVGREALAPYISLFDIALQPEVTPYASPLKLFEYMALSRAIVAPNAPNIREILTDGTDALLFEPNDPASLAQAIRGLAADPGLRASLGRAAAHKIVEDDITWARNARRVISLIRGTKRGSSA